MKTVVSLSQTLRCTRYVRCFAFFCFALASLFTACSSGNAQTPEWTWMGGSSTSDVFGCNAASYGTKSVPSFANIPGGRSQPNTWLDKNGNFWLFGGFGCAATADDPVNLNDLWEFNPITYEWTWMGTPTSPTGPVLDGVPAATWTDTSGNLWLFARVNSSTATYASEFWELDPSTLQWTLIAQNASSGNYGKLGVAASTNLPGPRWASAFWTDSSGNFWMFGGAGVDSTGTFGELNDLWEFSPSSGEWTWVGGSNVAGASGTYGSLGDPSTGNIPGARDGAVTWTDPGGNFWLFGPAVNDLWEFNPSTKEWAWMAGSSTVQLPNYGKMGVAATTNIPGQRSGSASWTDADGNLWLFGGFGATDDWDNEASSNGLTGWMNDLWQFTPANKEWTWVGGSSSEPLPNGYPAVLGVYGALGVPATTNVIGSRDQPAFWKDNQGKVWIFGGSGFASANSSFSTLNDLWVYAVPTPAPTFNLAAGSYPSAQSVTITEADSSATVYYTTDGSTPTINSTQYAGPVIINESTETLQAIAGGPGLLASTPTSATYHITGLPPAPAPTFSPLGGAFTAPHSIAITDSASDAIIYYSIGGTPTLEDGIRYAGPFTISSTEVVSAIAIAPGHSVSAEKSESYTITTTTAQLALHGSNPYQMACTISGSGINGVAGPTGTVTFTDTTTGQTIGTAALGSQTASHIHQTATYGVASEPGFVITGDFNGDGTPDLAVATFNGLVQTLLGNGDGTFQTGPVIDAGSIIAAGTAITNLVAGDFNNDGKLDLAVTFRGSQKVATLLGNGDGSFTAASGTAQAAAVPAALATGDFNGDGNLDIAVAGGGDVSILFGNGKGGFAVQSPIQVGTSLTGIVAGAFTGKSNPLDLVVTDSPSHSYSFLLGNGDGTFQAQSPVRNELSNPPLLIASADFNSDGNLDVVISDSLSFTVLLGNGDGTFQYSPALVQSVSPDQVVAFGVADYDGDGIPDVIFSDDNGVVALLPGIGNGTFSGPKTITTAPSSYVSASLPVADFNGDGVPDIALAMPFNNSVETIVSAFDATGSGQISNATVNVSGIATHALQCSYSGDSNYGAGTSPLINQTYSSAGTPVFSLLVGIYPGSQTVSISDSSSLVKVYYTTDGSNPTSSSTPYAGPITISSSVKLKAIAEGATYLDSQVSEAVYTIAEAPQLPQVTGVQKVAQTVTMADKTPGAVIYYTTDGTAPTSKSTRYTKPFTLLKSATVRAFATAPGYVNSRVAEESYSISLSKPAITWVAPAAIVYGTALGTKQLNATSTAKGTFAYSPKRGTVLDAGLHAITVTFTPSNPDAYAAVTKTIEISVKHATLTVAAVNEKITAGQPIPHLTYTLSGFVNGDNRNRLSGAPAETTTAKDGSKPGGYPITITRGTLGAMNYVFTFKNAILTITP